ncbi:MAG: YdcF family protein, partial [Ignavibacteriaceae bacterium]
MFFILSKVLFVLVMPLTIITACFLISLFTNPPKLKRKFFITGIVLLLLFSNEFIINEIFLIWEPPPTPFNEINQEYDLAIILTGVVDLTPPLNDRIFFNKGADRIIHPLYLYHQGKIRQFLIVGGSGALIKKERPESEIVEEFLKSFDVPKQDIIIETNSRNTHQSAVNTAKMIKEGFGNQSILLVT